MTIRIAISIALATVLSACAGEVPTSTQLLSTSAVQPQLSVAPQPTARPIGMHENMPKKSMADRVLTAIALERVTGLKPDPSRLMQ